MAIFDDVYENLENAIENGYEHDNDKPAKHYIDEMIEQGALRDTIVNGGWEYRLAVKAVHSWRDMRSI